MMELLDPAREAAAAASVLLGMRHAASHDPLARGPNTWGGARGEPAPAALPPRGPPLPGGGDDDADKARPDGGDRRPAKRLKAEGGAAGRREASPGAAQGGKASRGGAPAAAGPLAPLPEARLRDLWAPLPDGRAQTLAATGCRAFGRVGSAVGGGEAASKRSDLMVLATAFLAAYGKGAGERTSVRLDEAAVALGVAKRRLYDVVNVLEPLGIMRRTSKLTYDFITCDPYLLTAALFSIQREPIQVLDAESVSAEASQADRPHPAAAPTAVNGGRSRPSSPGTPGSPSGEATGAQTPGDGEAGAQRSLWVLTRRFVRLMMATTEPLALPHAAQAIARTAGVGRGVSTVERRLGDIGSIFASFGLVEKTTLGRRTPAFRWARQQPAIQPLPPSLGAPATRPPLPPAVSL